MVDRFYRDTSITHASKLRDLEQKKKMRELQIFEDKKKALQEEVYNMYSNILKVR